MRFSDIKLNNRIQFEVECDNSALRNVRGIVLAVGEASIILVTDFGELIEVFEDHILSITSISMPKLVSDAMTELKNHFAEIYELELKLKELRDEEPMLKQNLFDANFLSKFNIHGAKNRLDKSIEQSLTTFRKDTVLYQISFGSNPNSQIEIYIIVSNQIEYPNLDEDRDVDKIIRVHAPNEKEIFEKCFAFASKPKELEKKVVHQGESIYNIQTHYQMNVDVTKENFLGVRQQIVKALMQLQK
ncbi:hypothetical protein JOD82_001700 [Paenibacillus sp. 1182]|uniref:hypothetical protein n=1 Tax=Paenibacillus sp. 1182 TaxID=2806565 RepID=UPI001AE4E822|nr:hypothetical protein [Paenibacillus sp. 1182]MBP1308680.1 hypothetical protein [Paenibacillus sp. 1182]